MNTPRYMSYRYCDAAPHVKGSRLCANVYVFVQFFFLAFFLSALRSINMKQIYQTLFLLRSAIWSEVDKTFQIALVTPRKKCIRLFIKTNYLEYASPSLKRLNLLKLENVFRKQPALFVDKSVNSLVLNDAGFHAVNQGGGVRMRIRGSELWNSLLEEFKDCAIIKQFRSNSFTSYIDYY